jgi:hypothetical protein
LSVAWVVGQKQLAPELQRSCRPRVAPKVFELPPRLSEGDQGGQWQ